LDVELKLKIPDNYGRYHHCEREYLVLSVADAETGTVTVEVQHAVINVSIDDLVSAVRTIKALQGGNE